MLRFRAWRLFLAGRDRAALPGKVLLVPRSCSLPRRPCAAGCEVGAHRQAGQARACLLSTAPGGFLDDLSASLPALVIPDGGHHVDLYWTDPAGAAGPPAWQPRRCAYCWPTPGAGRGGCALLCWADAALVRACRCPARVAPRRTSWDAASCSWIRPSLGASSPTCLPPYLLLCRRPAQLWGCADKGAADPGTVGGCVAARRRGCSGRLIEALAYAPPSVASSCLPCATSFCQTSCNAVRKLCETTCLGAQAGSQRQSLARQCGCAVQAPMVSWQQQKSGAQMLRAPASVVPHFWLGWVGSVQVA